MSKKIKITVITPAVSDGNDLKNYYFKEENGQLNFYSPSNSLLYSNVQLNTAFSVPVNNLTFNITVTNYVADQSASGNWNDLSPVADPGSGTFQAQAGATVDDEAASSATA